MDAASTGNRITIAVAHRLSTVTNADRIFVFMVEGLSRRERTQSYSAKGGYMLGCAKRKIFTLPFKA